MPYDPQELTPRDVIRGMAGDTAEPEWLPDETYDAILARRGVPAEGWASSPLFLRAGSEILRRVAIAIENAPSSFTAVGDMAVSWSNRTRTLRDLADELDGQAGAIEEDEAGVIGYTRISSRFLTGSGVGDEW